MQPDGWEYSARTIGTGGQYLVTWEDHSTNTQIYARRINGDGSQDGSHFFVLAGAANRNPAVAASESARRYLVVATREGGAANDTICGQEISPTANILSPGARIGDEACFGGPSADYSALVAGPIGGFLAAWQDKPVSATETDVYGQLWGNRVYLPLVVRKR